MPDPERFRALLASLLPAGRAVGPVRLRLYGEMVHVLWASGQRRAAIRLERLWDEAMQEHAFSLLCAYGMGEQHGGPDHDEHLEEVCRSHSHVFPTEAFARLDDPEAQHREVCVLQQRARLHDTESRLRKELEESLREQQRVEQALRVSLDREQEARSQAEASAAYKEIFLGIIGHDLRNPLNAILLTAEMMVHRSMLSDVSRACIERVAVSGRRMKRMVDQLLEMTRARLVEGIAVVRREQHLVPIVAKIVDELRAAHPHHQLELGGDAACWAWVDGDRFEQVISNLVGNAIAHGDPAQPITVVVRQQANDASVCVHNFGPAIEAALLDELFDPFKRGTRAHANREGLGLGLYITKRIIDAHTGRIEVMSSNEAGTAFEVTVPRRRPG
ncbi:MAG: MEDS domain-containing protein [Deltaproteobacteria bacterium]|nr:MEDS domain-containing protein [Deltaproteobacteria bacterium]